MGGIAITPKLPDNYNGPKRRMWCSYCKRNFYVADIYYQRHKPIFYCNSCSIKLSHNYPPQQIEQEIAEQVIHQHETNNAYTSITEVEHETIVTTKHEYTQLYPLKATSTRNAHEVAIRLTVEHTGTLDTYVVGQFVYVFTVVDIQHSIMQLTYEELLEELHIQPLPIALKYVAVTYDTNSITSKQRAVGKVAALSTTQLKCCSCSSRGLYICKSCHSVFCYGHIFQWNNEYYCSVHLPLYDKHQQF